MRKPPPLAALLLPLCNASCSCGASDGAGGSAAAGGASISSTSGTTSTSTTPTDAGGGAGAGGEAPSDGIQRCDAIPASTEPVPPGYPAGAKRIRGLPAEVEVFELPPPADSLSWIQCGVGCFELETPWAEPGKGALLGMTQGGMLNEEPWLALEQRLAGGIVLTRVGPVFGNASGGLVEREVTGLVDVGFSSPRALGSPIHIVMVFYRDQETWAYGLRQDASPVCLARGPGNWGPMSGAYTAGRWATAGSMQPVVTALWPAAPDGPGIELITAPNGDTLDETAAVGDRFAWSGYGYDHRLRLWTWSADTAMTQLVVPADPATEDLCCAAADDATVVWQRGVERHDDPEGWWWGRIELWRHPLPIDSVPIVGSLVRQVPEVALAYPGLVHGDYFAHFGQEPGGVEFAYIVRLSDGQLWKIPPRAADLRWRKLLYLSSDEVALLEGYFGGPDPAWTKTVVRYRLDSLGPGEPSGG